MSPGNVAISSPDVHEACRITIVFTILYTACLVNQTVNKYVNISRAKQAKENFDRYNSLEMRSADRMLANMMEWSFVFFPLLWSLALTGRLVSSGDDALKWSWRYIYLRGLYIILSIRYGVASNGKNKPLWVSTFPAYVCLLCMFKKAIVILWE